MKLTRKGQFIMHDLLPLGGIFRLLLLFKQNKNERIKIEGFYWMLNVFIEDIIIKNQLGHHNCMSFSVGSNHNS